MTTGFNDLAAILGRWDGRRRRRELLAALPRGVAVGLAVGLAVALLSRARPWLTRAETVQVAALLLLVAVVAAALIVLLRRRSLAEQARFADRQFGLRERMAAAVEIHAGTLEADAAVTARQLQDALTVAATVNAERQLPLHSRWRDWLPAVTALALLTVALWLPNPQEAILLEQRAVAAEVASQAANLGALRESIAADETLTSGQQAALQQPLDEALAALTEPGISREAAVAALSGAEGELRRLNQEFDGAALSRALAAAGLDAGANSSSLTQALQDGDPARAGNAAAALSGELGGLTAAEQAALAEELAATAAALATTDEALAEALNAAAEALDAGDTATASAALDEAAVALEERAVAATVAEQAATAAEQVDAAQQAIAQAGGAPGNSGQEGVAGGEGAGEESGGDATAGAGNESGDGAGGSTGGDGATAGEGTASGGPSPGGGHVESVYVPPSADLGDEGQALELEVQCLNDPATCGPSGGQSPSPLPSEPGAGGQVPYDQVFGDYRDAAFETLATGDIPLRLQGIIRNYFAALEP